MTPAISEEPNVEPSCTEKEGFLSGEATGASGALFESSLEASESGVASEPEPLLEPVPIDESLEPVDELEVSASVEPEAKATDQVKCHYEGTLIDGTLFDSSIKRGEPAVFGVNQVIPGWVEALQLIPEGSKWKLYIPSDLAYGARGAGEMIPPHSTLVFEVELLEVL